mmetsp:Transcript_3943/g.3729  ORF Transcript_3943/g.3729 Transcript_3943/m.3729 type:complete len:229 (+) Transcript_3943:92-778(+)
MKLISISLPRLVFIGILSISFVYAPAEAAVEPNQTPQEHMHQVEDSQNPYGTQHHGEHSHGHEQGHEHGHEHGHGHGHDYSASEESRHAENYHLDGEGQHTMHFEPAHHDNDYSSGLLRSASSTKVKPEYVSQSSQGDSDYQQSSKFPSMSMLAAVVGVTMAAALLVKRQGGWSIIPMRMPTNADFIISSAPVQQIARMGLFEAPLLSDEDMDAGGALNLSGRVTEMV